MSEKSSPKQENDLSNLFLDDSDDNPNEENIKDLFTSTESSESVVEKKVKPKKEILIATTGMSTIGDQISDNIDNNQPDFIDEEVKPKNKLVSITSVCENINNQPELESEVDSVETKNDSLTVSIKDNRRNRCRSSMMNSMTSKTHNENGWDENATKTINNWYNIFKELSFVYQWVLDRNRKMSDRLATISVISSSALGIFSAFKLWIDNDALFQTVSNIILMFLNFGVALITSLSKRYVDDQKNETIRTYIEDVDSFLGEIAAQVLKMPIYRMNAEKFFKTNNDKYTKLISCTPNLSLTDLSQGKAKYKMYYPDDKV
jgi:hypothetical protein